MTDLFGLESPKLKIIGVKCLEDQDLVPPKMMVSGPDQHCFGLFAVSKPIAVKRKQSISVRYCHSNKHWV